MKPKHTLRLLGGSLATLLFTHTAQATDLYWDTNGADADAGTTAGTWGTSAFWNSDSSGGFAGGEITLPTADDDLFFSAGTNSLLNNIALTGTLAANKITFDDPLATATTLTLNGATSLTLGGGTGSNSGIYVSSTASGGTVNRIVISQPLTLAADVTFQNDSTSTNLRIDNAGTAAFNVTLKNNSHLWDGVSIGALNNTGTVTNSGTGSGDVGINGVIGTNVTGVIQNSLTSALVVNSGNTYTSATTLTAGILHIVGGNLGNAGSGAGALGNGGNIVFNGGILQLGGNGTLGDPSNRFTVTSNSDYKIDTNGRAMTLATALPTNDTNGLHKYGPATLTLTGANNYTGTTTIGGIDVAGAQRAGGTAFVIATPIQNILRIGDGTASTPGSLVAGGTDLTFQGTGVFQVSKAAGVSQVMKALTFGGGDGTVRSSFQAGANIDLTFSSLAARAAGATGNFYADLGINGSENKISLSGASSNTFLDRGLFFSDGTAANNALAWYDSSGYVRAMNYAGDAGATTSAATTALASATHQQITGSVSAQNTATFSTLNLKGGSNLTLASGQTLTADTLFKSGGTAAVISGGTGIQAASNAEMIIRNDDQLTISSAILANGANALTKSGAGALILRGANTYTGDTVINDSTLVLSSPSNRIYGGVISGAGNLVVNGPGALTLNGAASNTFTGFLVVTGGNLVADFSNMTVPQQLLPQGIEDRATPTNGWALGTGSAINGTQGEGSITIVGKPGAYTTVQKFGNKGQSGSPAKTFTVTGTGRILVDPNGGTETQVFIGMLDNGTGSSLLIGKPSGAGAGNVVFSSYRSAGQTHGSGNSHNARVYFTTDGGTTVYHTSQAGGSFNGGSGQVNRELPMEPTLGGTAYGTMTTLGGGGYLKLTGDAIAVAGGTFTMTGAFGTQGRNQFFKIESPVADQTLAMTGNNNFGYGGLLIDGSGTGTFTISGGNIQSESNTQSNISYFAQFSSLDVNVTSNIDNTNTGGIAKFGDGRLILSNANTYVGTSRLTDGILQVNATDTPGASGPLGASSAVGSIQFSGGILQYGSGFTKDYSSRFSVTDTSPFKIDTNGNDVTYATAIGGGTASTLTKLGDGALNLTNANTYTGLTTVSGGTLVARNAANTSPVLAGPISVTSGGTLNVIDNLMGGLPTVTGAINVADGGTLGGDAIIAGSTTIDGNHAPGLSLSAGIQTFSNGLAYLAASNLKWRLNDDVSAATTGVRGISFDGVDVTGGNFSITSGATIDLSFGGSVDFLESFWDTDQSWIVVDLSGTASGTGGTDVFTVGAFTGATPAGGSFSVSRVSDDVVLNWVASAGGASFATWAAAFSSPALADQAADADPDFDGLDNALEYVIGSDPRVSNQGGPSGGVVGTNLVMNLTRVDSSETADVGLEVQVSNDLQDWTTIAGYTIGSDTATSTSGVVVSENAAADDTITVTIPKGTAPSKFARLRVVITP